MTEPTPAPAPEAAMAPIPEGEYSPAPEGECCNGTQAQSHGHYYRGTAVRSYHRSSSNGGVINNLWNLEMRKNRWLARSVRGIF